MIRIVALTERYYHCEGFVYMRDGQDYQVMNDNNSRSLAKHFLLFLCVSRQKTPLVSLTMLILLLSESNDSFSLPHLSLLFLFFDIINEG